MSLLYFTYLCNPLPDHDSHLIVYVTFDPHYATATSEAAVTQGKRKEVRKSHNNEKKKAIESDDPKENLKPEKLKKRGLRNEKKMIFFGFSSLFLFLYVAVG